MKITVIHGETIIKIKGKHSFKKMKKAVIELLDTLPETQQVEEEHNPIGFSIGATIERAPDPEPEYFFTDDEE